MGKWKKNQIFKEGKTKAIYEKNWVAIWRGQICLTKRIMDESIKICFIKLPVFCIIVFHIMGNIIKCDKGLFFVTYVISFNLCNNSVRYVLLSYFTSEETEAQKDLIISQGSHGWWAWFQQHIWWLRSPGSLTLYSLAQKTVRSLGLWRTGPDLSLESSGKGAGELLFRLPVPHDWHT